MKILWVTYDLPFPLNSGGKQRSYHLLRGLKEADFDVTLFSFYRREEQRVYSPELLKIVSRLELFKRRYVWDPRNLGAAVFSSKPLLIVSYEQKDFYNVLERAVRREGYDLIHLEFFGVAFSLPLLKKYRQKVIFGGENIEHEIYSRYTERESNPFLKGLMSLDVYKMKQTEEKYWRLADFNLAVSDADAGVIEKIAPGRVAVVPNGIDSALYAGFGKIIHKEVMAKALFVGDLLYAQNSHAVQWFCREVWPIVRRSYPFFRLVVVSATAPDWTKEFEVLELIVDHDSGFEKFVERADLFVLPIWVKSGTNIKLLQSLAVGYPTVSTSLGLAGYPFQNGRELLVADNADGFARAVSRLLGDFQIRSELSSRGRKRALGFDWGHSVRRLLKVYETVIER